MFGRPPPLLPKLADAIHAEIHNHTLLKSLQALQSVQSQPVHPFQPGYKVLVKRFATSGLTGLTPRWKGPYTMILLTPMTIKVDGLTAWIHHSHVKTAPPRCRIKGGLIYNRPPKAKTVAPFSVIILISLIPATTLQKGPPLMPTYYQWVLTEGSWGNSLVL
ncbi:hypothetical protein AAY473_039244 [Plecturocebus cupreus]